MRNQMAKMGLKDVRSWSDGLHIEDVKILARCSIAQKNHERCEARRNAEQLEKKYISRLETPLIR